MVCFLFSRILFAAVAHLVFHSMQHVEGSGRAQCLKFETVNISENKKLL